MAPIHSSPEGSSRALSNVDRYFSFSPVRSEAERQTTYRIRYQVYCVERGFLDPDSYPEGLESDEFDAHSLHILASHRDGQPAGTARLVTHSELGFPLESHCELDPGIDALRVLEDPRVRRYAEISRLAVSKMFRRRTGDTFYGGPPRQPAGDPAGAEIIELPPQRETPQIVSGIYRVLYQESKRRGIEHWVVAMERGLQIILKRAGFHFVPIGPKVDYFGPVRPYAASIAAIDRHLFRAEPAMLRFLLTGLERELWPAYVRDQGDGWGELASIA